MSEDSVILRPRPREQNESLALRQSAECHAHAKPKAVGMALFQFRAQATHGTTGWVQATSTSPFAYGFGCSFVLVTLART